MTDKQPAACPSEAAMKVWRDAKRTYFQLPAEYDPDQAAALVIERAMARPATAQGDVEALDEDDLLDELADAISDSLDMDWTSTDGARAVLPIVQRLMTDRELFIRIADKDDHDDEIRAGHHFTWEVEEIARHREQAAAEERAKIVAYLVKGRAGIIAANIEAEEHLK